MRLLITTQAVDRTHSNLGFFHSWLAEFAKRCESVHVICLQEGEHQLPPNVHIHSLGKPYSAKASKGTGALLLSRISYTLLFYKYIFSLRGRYDAVFVHMNPEYVALGGVLWKTWGKRIGLWYVHKSVTLWLRLSASFADVIFTVSPESISLRSSKVRAVGHGIDTDLFSPAVRSASNELRILSVGRIAQSKGLIEILSALDVLHARRASFTFTIVGAPLTADERSYEKILRSEIAKRPDSSRIHLAGSVQNNALPNMFRAADVLVNISMTGGFDKVVLEALASGVPAVSSSAPFRNLLAPHGLFIESTQPESIADAIQKAVTIDVSPLRADIEKNHSLKALIPKILSALALHV